MEQVDLSVFEKQASKFKAYVYAADKIEAPLDFVDRKGLLVKEEGYKSRISSQARTVLSTDEWDESWLGSGEIPKRIYKVMDLAGNLINFNSRIDFRKHFEQDKKEYNPDSEKVIYDLFKSDDDEKSFARIVKVFGAKYPIVSYLFFVKNDEKYLPVSPESFDRAFKDLNIDFTMSYKCSWNNYCQYLNIVREIQDTMPRYLDISHPVRLIDAHSFAWIIGEKKFKEWGLNASDINTPLVPLDIISEPNGIVRYKCARCSELFKQARRCPECGQAVKQ